MSVGRNQQIYDLFRSACRLPGDQRPAFLDKHCGDDAALRRELEHLLAEDDAADGFLETPALMSAVSETRGGGTSWLPSRIGQYRILERLAEGGMGVVYRAEQDTPRRVVALKMLRASPTPRQIRRFEYEAETLARLQHPGIAQIYDAGTMQHGGAMQPFFAMEMVKGLPVTEHAATLPLRDKITLLIGICEAIQHAHQKGVIHRDLKPANILVTPHGQPKVLDFGVARAADCDLQLLTAQTQVGELIGTLPYMSPEQAEGKPEAIDIRCDVYALGVVGYELLAGRLPYDLRNRALDDAIHVIRHIEPDTLSSADSAFRGDLETIFAKALQKDRQRRYASVAQLQADLESFLRHEPISARPPGAGYRLWKFARRHRVVVCSAALIALALLAGSVTTTWQWLRAEHALTAETNARRQAQREAAKATAVSGFVVDMFSSASPRKQGRDLRVVDVVDEAQRDIARQFQEQPLLAAELHQTLGILYRHLGLPEQSAAEHRQALQLRRAQLSADHPDVLASAHHLAIVLFELGKLAEAEEIGTQTLELQQRVHGPTHAESLSTMNNLALVWWQQGQLKEAERLMRQTWEGYRQRLGERDDRTQTALGNLALILHEQGKLEEAEPHYRENLAVTEENFGPDHPQSLTIMNNLAALLKMQGRARDAEALFVMALPRSEKILGTGHPDTLNLVRNLAIIRLQQARWDEAEQGIRDALTRAERTLPADHWFVCQLRGDLGWCLYHRQEYPQAQALLRASLDGLAATKGADHPRTAAVRQRWEDCLRASGGE